MRLRLTRKQKKCSFCKIVQEKPFFFSIFVFVSIDIQTGRWSYAKVCTNNHVDTQFMDKNIQYISQNSLKYGYTGNQNMYHMYISNPEMNRLVRDSCIDCALSIPWPTYQEANSFSTQLPATPSKTITCHFYISVLNKQDITFEFVSFRDACRCIFELWFEASCFPLLALALHLVHRYESDVNLLI